MLELQVKWFLVLLVNFLVLIYVLNILLFKPLLRLLKKGQTMSMAPSALQRHESEEGRSDCKAEQGS